MHEVQEKTCDSGRQSQVSGFDGDQRNQEEKRRKRRFSFQMIARSI